MPSRPTKRIVTGVLITAEKEHSLLTIIQLPILRGVTPMLFCTGQGLDRKQMPSLNNMKSKSGDSMRVNLPRARGGRDGRSRLGQIHSIPLKKMSTCALSGLNAEV